MIVPSVSILGTRGYPSYYGGFETLVRHIAPYLADAGWEVTVYGRKSAVELDDPHRHYGVTSVLTPGIDSKSASTLSHGLFATASVLRQRPDVVLALNVANGYFLPMLRAAGIPVAMNVDGLEWERDKWGSLAKRMFRAGADLSARYATQLIYDSLEVEAYWREAYGRAGDFIPYGGKSPRQLPLPPHVIRGAYVLYVARFTPENSLTDFLEAAESLPISIPVIIVGSSGYGGMFDEQVRRLSAVRPNIRWYGHVADDDLLLALWQHCGVYFHGHTVGGTNPALVQAMACGAPIVAADNRYNREVLGAGGMYTTVSASAIACSLTQVLSSSTLRHRLSANAIERAAAHYTWDDV